METILLVTWIYAKQPPTSYQTMFSSARRCEVARAAVINSLEVIRYRIKQDAAAAGDLADMALLGAPKVSAVCVAQ